MSIKLLLAEALDTLKKAEDAERGADALQVAMSKGKTGRDFGKVRRQYSAAYDVYIRGLELLNYVRRYAIDAAEGELNNFCAQRMEKYMDHCDRLREKEASILMSVEQADQGGMLDKEGYAVGEKLLFKRVEMKNNTPIRWTEELTTGAYQVILKNYDDHSVAAPLVSINVEVVPKSKKAKPMRFRKVVPGRCAWSKYVGVATGSTIVVHVTTDAWVRASRIELTFRSLEPLEDSSPTLGAGPASPGALPPGFLGLPRLPSDGADDAGGFPELPAIPGGPDPFGLAGMPLPGIDTFDVPVAPPPEALGIVPGMPPAAPAMGFAPMPEVGPAGAQPYGMPHGGAPYPYPPHHMYHYHHQHHHHHHHHHAGGMDYPPPHFAHHQHHHYGYGSDATMGTPVAGSDASAAAPAPAPAGAKTAAPLPPAKLSIALPPFEGLSTAARIAAIHAAVVALPNASSATAPAGVTAAEARLTAEVAALPAPTPLMGDADIDPAAFDVTGADFE